MTKGDNRQLKMISTATLLEEAEQPKYLKFTLISVTLLLVILLIWASITQIKEKAITFGEIVPISGVHSIQHLEGGIIQQISIQNGASVVKGQLLVLINSESLEKEIAQYRARQLSLTLDAMRLKYFIRWEKPSLEDWAEALSEKLDYVRPSHASVLNTISDERERLMSQHNRRDNTLAVIDQQMAQQRQHVESLLQQQESVIENIGLIREETEIYEKLIGAGHISKKDYLAAKRKLNEAESQQEAIESDLEKARMALQENRQNREKTISEMASDASRELDRIQSDLLELDHLLARQLKRLERTSVVSPIDGVINNLVLAEGAVIPKGGYICDVVPDTGEMIVQTKVNPIDIGFISVGDQAIVKILTYDHARYGTIAGQVVHISADAFEDEQGLPYYTAKIHLEKMHVGDDLSKPVRPGMTVEANIVTGEKSLMAYLLKPIQTSLDRSFSER